MKTNVARPEQLCVKAANQPVWLVLLICFVFSISAYADGFQRAKGGMELVRLEE